MKNMKCFLFVIVLSFMLVILSSCSNMFTKEKTFTNAGLSITLTNKFHEKEHISVTSYYESEKMMVVVIKENFSLLSRFGVSENSSIEQYLELVISANNHKANLRKEDDIPYFTYERSDSGKDFKYVATAAKGSNAFYLVQYCVIEDTYDDLKDDIFKYASTYETE